MKKEAKSLAQLGQSTARKPAPAKSGLASLAANTAKGFIGDREFIPPAEHAHGKNLKKYVEYAQGLAKDAKEAKKPPKPSKTVDNPFK